MNKIAFRFFMVVICIIGIVTFVSLDDKTCITVSALEESGQCGKNVQWNFNESTGELIISGKGPMYDYEYNEAPFYDEIVSIKVKSGVTSVGDYAFETCQNLKKVILADTVKSIGFCAFSDCIKLESVDLGDGLDVINPSAFAHCSKLKSLVIPDSVTRIYWDVFMYCGLESIKIGKGLKTIEYRTFNNCKSLKSIVIPDNVTKIEWSAFSFCENLKSVTLGKNLKSIGEGAFAQCSSLSEIIIPASVTGFDEDVFYGSDNLTIHTDKNSEAHKYAKINSIPFMLHSYELKSTVVATFENNGKVTEKCKTCGYSKKSTVYKIKTVTLSKTSYTYDGSVKTPSVTVKDSKGNILKKDTDYTVKYSGGRKAVCIYKAKITFKGKYSGNKTLSFKIVLGKVKNVKQNTNKKGLYVSWDNVKGATGYQIYEYKNGSWEKLITLKSNINYVYNSSVVEKVKWKIRAYYTDKNGKVHYGAFTDTLQFKGITK